ncbi:hypothetical protein HBN50_00370 [Halobacteriovorax sp. GB3]|uniref:hypothetical protein n=1 Tax=Halobacteriovorax sp. GB3 TaxID=2719615 RepID=UPI00236201F7|nr:hypothetical protein [Halobacteriovorax sp. GB3]MDD0851520.1 hypothetical protein [Halobacteriovorax sp. GB3]
MKQEVNLRTATRVLIKKCHSCGHMMESTREIEKCNCCNKSFLPSNYFSKVHAKNSEEFRNLFCHIDEMHEEDLVKGISVIW